MRRVLVAIGVVSALTVSFPAASVAAAKSVRTEVGLAFLKRLFATTPGDFAGASKLAAKGSDASTYVRYQQARSDAFRANGQQDYSETVTREGNAVKACIKGTLPAGTQRCGQFDTFKIDTRNKLVSFSTDGNPIEGRLAGGASAVAPALGVNATFRGAYDSRSDGGQRIVIALDVQNGGDGPRNVYATSSYYVGPDGLQQNIAPGSTLQPSAALQPGAKGIILVAYEGAQLGGTLHIPVNSGAPDYQQGELTVPVGAAQ